VRVVQIVKPIDLGDIDGIRQPFSQKRGVPFVPGHMHGTGIGRGVFQKLVTQHAFPPILWNIM